MSISQDPSTAGINSETETMTQQQQQQQQQQQPQSLPPTIDLQTCTPDELSAWLLSHRFQDNAMDVASFLLNCTSTLPNAEEISAQLLGGGAEDDDDEDDDDDDDDNDDTEMEDGESKSTEIMPAIVVAAVDPITTSIKVDPQTQLLHSIQTSPPLPDFAITTTTNTANNTNNDTNEITSKDIEVSCINPRGKFLLSMHEHGILLTNPKKREEEQIPIYSGAINTNTNNANTNNANNNNNYNNVKHVIWFRKPEDYKKVKQLSKNGFTAVSGKSGKVTNKGVIPGHMVLICLEEDAKEGGIAFRDKPLKQVCFQLPSYSLPSSATDNGNNGDDNGDGTTADGKHEQYTEEQWYNGLSTALVSQTASSSSSGIVRVHTAMEDTTTPSYYSPRNGTKKFVFESEGEPGSATTTQGMPYVGCYRGFNDGALFPLREGLLFFKPPLFVPRSKLASISCGRGSGGSRYVDMTIQLESSANNGDDDNDNNNNNNEQEGKKKKKKRSTNDDTLEFTNIHRDELVGLNDYIHETLIPAMQMDADGIPEEGDEDNEDDDDGDDDAEEVVAEVVNTSEDDNDDDDDDDDDEGRNGDGSNKGEVGGKRRSSRAASKSAREITRATLRSTPGDADSDEEDEFDEEDEDSEEDESVVSDGESESDSSDDDEDNNGDDDDDDDDEEEERDDGSDGSDYEDRKRSKRARVE